MKDPLETAELVAFVRTVDANSLSRASRDLGIPRATLSRRLSRLEARLGVRLLRRTTRSLALTDAGTGFYRQAREVVDAVRRAEESIRITDAGVRGALRVSAPPITTPGFLKLCCDFAERYPDVELQVNTTTQHVDLYRDAYDVAIRASPELQPGLVARPLSRTTLVAIAAPKYLECAPPLRSAKDLRQHRCIAGFARGRSPETQWPLRGGRSVHVDATFSANNIFLLREAALRGLGVALVPWFVVRPDVSCGRLVHVLPGIVHAATAVSVVYPEREYLPAQVRAFIDLLLQAAPQIFPPDDHPPPRKRRVEARRSRR